MWGTITQECSIPRVWRSWCCCLLVRFCGKDRVASSASYLSIQAARMTTRWSTDTARQRDTTIRTGMTIRTDTTIRTDMTIRTGMTICTDMTIRTDMTMVRQRLTGTTRRLVRSALTTKRSNALGLVRGGTHKIAAPLAVVGQLR